MSVCEKASCWQSSLSFAFHRDVVTYGALICASRRGGRWDQALLLLEEMAERRLRPNAVCLTAAGEWRRGLALAREPLHVDVKAPLAIRGEK